MNYEYEYRLAVRLAANQSALRETRDPKLRAALAIRIRDIKRELQDG